jgi:hypothetical protein
MRHHLLEPWESIVGSLNSNESWEALEPSLQRAILDAPVGAVKNTQAETSDSEDDLSMSSEDSWTASCGHESTASEEDCGSDGDEDDSGSSLYLGGSVEGGT